jgi:hypothetical protein
MVNFLAGDNLIWVFSSRRDWVHDYNGLCVSGGGGMGSRVLVELWWGFSLVFALHFGFTALALLLLSLVGSSGGSGAAFTWFFALFGLSQLLYVLPIMRLYWVRGRRERVKGMTIAAAITMLLNGSCYVANFGGIQIFIGVCLGLVGLISLSILTARRN